jgi:hypothetical protein
MRRLRLVAMRALAQSYRCQRIVGVAGGPCLGMSFWIRHMSLVENSTKGNGGKTERFTPFPVSLVPQPRIFPIALALACAAVQIRSTDRAEPQSAPHNGFIGAKIELPASADRDRSLRCRRTPSVIVSIHARRHVRSWLGTRGAGKSNVLSTGNANASRQRLQGSSSVVFTAGGESGLTYRYRRQARRARPP